MDLAKKLLEPLLLSKLIDSLRDATKSYYSLHRRILEKHGKDYVVSEEELKQLFLEAARRGIEGVIKHISDDFDSIDTDKLLKDLADFASKPFEVKAGDEDDENAENAPTIDEIVFNPLEDITTSEFSNPETKLDNITSEDAERMIDNYFKKKNKS